MNIHKHRSCALYIMRTHGQSFMKYKYMLVIGGEGDFLSYDTICQSFVKKHTAVIAANFTSRYKLPHARSYACTSLSNSSKWPFWGIQPNKVYHLNLQNKVITPGMHHQEPFCDGQSTFEPRIYLKHQATTPEF